jgi:hypothetical protein
LLLWWFYPPKTLRLLPCQVNNKNSGKQASGFNGSTNSVIIHSFVTITRLLCLSCVAEEEKAIDREPGRAATYLHLQMASLRPSYLFFFFYYSFSTLFYFRKCGFLFFFFASAEELGGPGNSWLFPGARFFCTRYIYSETMFHGEKLSLPMGAAAPPELYVFTTGKEEEEEKSRQTFFLLLLLLLQQQSPKSLEDVLLF